MQKGYTEPNSEAFVLYPLLTAKLCPPLPPPDLIARSQLQARLLNGLNRALTVVSAPPGFGKTTLVARALEGQTVGRALAWLTLHSDENDPARFLTYLLGSLELALPGLTQDTPDVAMQLGGGPPHHLLIPILNRLNEQKARLVVVLDDYHVISSSGVHMLLRFLVENRAPGMHLVIISRVDPPLPLARYRAAGLLSELRVDSLRFTQAETRSFFEQTLGLTLGPQHLSALDARFEGWAVGLQLASLSLQTQQDVTLFVQSFSGSNRYILPYLLDEVLSGLDPPTRQFLLETSILDALNAGVCTALTDVKDAQEQLEQLEERNLFTFALDPDRQWFRYHPLFAELLRHQLQKRQPDRPALLHRRAAVWFDNTGDPYSTVKHALAAADYPFAASFMAKHAEQLYVQGEVATLERWLSPLPQEVLVSFPRLMLIRAINLQVTGEPEAATALFDQLDETLTHGVPDEREYAQLKGRLMAFKASIASVEGQPSDALAQAHAALRVLPEDDLRWRAIVTHTVGVVHTAAGEPELALEAFSQAERLNKRVAYPYGILAVMWRTARVQASQGRLREAAATLADVQDFAPQWGLMHLAVPAYAQLDAADIHRETNELEKALACLQAGLERAQEAGGPHIAVEGHLTLARVKHALDDADGSDEAFLNARRVIDKHRLPQLLSDILEAWQARLTLYRGNVLYAERWLRRQNLGVTESSPYLREVISLTRARLLLYQGEKQQARMFLEPLREEANRKGRQRSVIELLLLEALAQDETSTGLKQLEQAISLAEPEGFVRMFLDEKASLYPLLSLLSSRHSYANKLAALMQGILDPKSVKSMKTAPVDAAGLLVEPLSEREHTVLLLVVQGLATKAIAKQLGVSANTVRTHIYNIFSKLNAHNRLQMIAKARELGLIE